MTTARSLVKRGKRYQDIAKLVEYGRTYLPEEAIDLVKQTARTTVDETVECHIRTNADPRHADQLIRSVVMLPHGSGKTRTVLAFVQGEAEAIARDAGVDYIGDEETIARIEKNGWVEFDVSIATPDMMGRIGRLGRILGRRGLMPNPRTGTVVQVKDLPRAIQEAKGGRLEFRMDRSANIHCSIGKASFSTQALLENLTALLDAVSQARPDGVKGQLYQGIHLATSMGPGVKLDLTRALSLKLA
jgi:large subunit ribosomal protein L1